MKRIVVDAEFDSLNPSRVWCVVARDIDTDLVSTFKEGDQVSFQNLINRCSVIVGHNILKFDRPHLERLWSINIPYNKIVDTLIVSRLIHAGKPGGHSVENWSKEFGLHKPEVKIYDDPKLVESVYIPRCIADTEIQSKIFCSLERFTKDPDWSNSLRVEHDTELVCLDMHENGFPYDIEGSETLQQEIREEMDVLEERMRQEIPPVLKIDKPLTLRKKKDGSLARNTLNALALDGSVSHGNLEISEGELFHRFHYEPFNPGSAKDRVEFLNKCGWKPFEKTKTHIQTERELFRLERKLNYASRRGGNRVGPSVHRVMHTKIGELRRKLERFSVVGWRVSEDNLGTLPSSAPESAHSLAEWLSLNARASDLEEWRAAFRESDGRIHGEYNGIGGWTQRKSHVRPNQGNIFSSFVPEQCRDPDNPSAVERVKLNYNGRLRSLWTAPPDQPDLVLVGTDAEAIQLRILAHYVDDEEMTNAIVNGSKHDGTDIHSLNRRKLGEVCRSRDHAKTFIYAWLLGASNPKIASILDCSESDARDGVDMFLRDTPGLRALKETFIESDARRGWFLGLDGRKVVCWSKHLMLAGYLQNGESVCMKHANIRWRRELERLGMWYQQINDVHDEWVTICRKQDAPAAGRVQCEALEHVGRQLGLKCPLAGETKIGRNWYEVH